MNKDHPQRIGFLIHDVSRLRRTVADKRLRPLGLTRSQSWVLAYLHRHAGAGMIQSELAREMSVGKVTIGGLIDRLEQSGYVERRPDAGDRRAHRIYMTTRGTSLVRKVLQMSEEINTELLQDIPEQDVAVAEAVLARIKQRLIALDAVPGTAGTDKVSAED